MKILLHANGRGQHGQERCAAGKWLPLPSQEWAGSANFFIRMAAICLMLTVNNRVGYRQFPKWIGNQIIIVISLSLFSIRKLLQVLSGIIQREFLFSFKAPPQMAAPVGHKKGIPVSRCSMKTLVPAKHGCLEQTWHAFGVLRSRRK